MDWFDQMKCLKVGVSLLVICEFDGVLYVLLGQCKGFYGEGEWGIFGGYQEFGECYEVIGFSELVEECGIDIKVIYLCYLCILNFMVYIFVGKYYIDVGFVLYWFMGDLKLMELEKCIGWLWYLIDQFFMLLFVVVGNFVIVFCIGQLYFV